MKSTTQGYLYRAKTAARAREPTRARPPARERAAPAATGVEVAVELEPAEAVLVWLAKVEVL